MKDFPTLKILDLFKFIFLKFGVDYPIMRKILQIKLTMDERRVPTVLMSNNDMKDENAFNKSLLMYLLMGFVFMLFIFIPFPIFYKMNIIIAMILFLATSVMVADYSSVLLDIKEKNILLPKPIDYKTLNTARIIHVFIYLFTIILTIATPTLVAGSFRFGFFFGGIFLVQLLFIASLIIFLTSLLYFLILYFFNGERLKDIINYFQIGLSVVMIVIYQLVGQIFQVFNLNVVYEVKWWNYFIPTTWFAAPYSYLIEGSKEIHYLHFTILSIIVPVIMLVLYFKVVSPYFEGVLQKLHSNSEGKNSHSIKAKKRQQKIASFFTTNKMESIFFRFTHNMVASERTLKLKLYPSLAFATILPLIFIFRFLTISGSFSESYEMLRNGNYFLYLYFAVIMMSNAIPLLSTSEKHKAVWLYKILPIEDINSIYKGSLKGYLLKYILPVYCFVAIPFILIYGVKIIFDILIVAIVLVLLMLIIFHYSDRPLPFSQDFQYIKHNNISILFQTMMFCGVTAGIHWLLVSSNFTRIPYGILLCIALIIFWKRMFASKITIEQGNKAENIIK